MGILGDQIANVRILVFSMAIMSYKKFKVSLSSYQCLTQSMLTSVCLAWVSQTTSELSTLCLPGANLRIQLIKSGRGRACDFHKAAGHSARRSEHRIHESRERGFGFQGWNCFLRLHWKHHKFSLHLFRSHKLGPPYACSRITFPCFMSLSFSCQPFPLSLCFLDLAANATTSERV